MLMGFDYSLNQLLTRFELFWDGKVSVELVRSFNPFTAKMSFKNDQ